MTAEQFNKALRKLGYSQAAFSRKIKRDATTVNRWATGQIDVPEPIAVLINSMVKYKEYFQDET